jgi:hypothetical protein
MADTERPKVVIRGSEEDRRNYLDPTARVEKALAIVWGGNRESMAADLKIPGRVIRNVCRGVVKDDGTLRMVCSKLADHAQINPIWAMSGNGPMRRDMQKEILSQQIDHILGLDADTEPKNRAERVGWVLGNVWGKDAAAMARDTGLNRGVIVEAAMGVIDVTDDLLEKLLAGPGKALRIEWLTEGSGDPIMTTDQALEEGVAVQKDVPASEIVLTDGRSLQDWMDTLGSRTVERVVDHFRPVIDKLNLQASAARDKIKASVMEEVDDRLKGVAAANEEAVRKGVKEVVAKIGRERGDDGRISTALVQINGHASRISMLERAVKNVVDSAKNDAYKASNDVVAEVRKHLQTLISGHNMMGDRITRGEQTVANVLAMIEPLVTKVEEVDGAATVEFKRIWEALGSQASAPAACLDGPTVETLKAEVETLRARVAELEQSSSGTTVLPEAGLKGDTYLSINRWCRFKGAHAKLLASGGDRKSMGRRMLGAYRALGIDPVVRRPTTLKGREVFMYRVDHMRLYVRWLIEVGEGSVDQWIGYLKANTTPARA